MHTPAPWFYDIGETEALIVEQDGTTIAEIRTTYQTTAHRSLEANTRLMTAAPDLLAALRFVLNDGNADLCAETAAIIQAAIDKATETN